MRILICGDSMNVGGAETHVLTLSAELARLGHEVTVASKSGELCRFLPREVQFAEIKIGSAAGISSLRELIGSGRFHIVHAHSRWTAFAVSAVRGSLPRIRFGFVVTAHALYRSHPIKDLLSAWGDATIAVSDDIKAMLTARFSLPRESVTVIGNGIDASDFKPCRKSRHGHKLLFVSRLDGDCSLGAELLCRIMPALCRRYPDATLTVAGGGDSLPKIQALARIANRRIGRRAVRVVGSVTAVAPLIAHCDLAVGVSRFALEAMATERNVILLGNEGGLGLLSRKNWDRAVKSNFTARGCGARDGDFLKREIISYFESSARERERNAEFCRKRVTEDYSIASVTAKTLAVYGAVLPAPTILLGGYYGFGNLGDETVRGVLESRIRASLPRARVLTLTRSAEGGESISRRSPLATLAAMRRADVYISGGGSLLQDSTSLRSLIYYCALISLSRLMGCRVAVIGGGIGPLKRRISPLLARAALSKCHYISLRDGRSLSTAARLIGGGACLRLSADPAFTEELSPSLGGETVAVSLSRGNEAAMKATASLSRPLLFISMSRRQDCGSAPRDLPEGGEMLKNCGGAVGSRLHFLIMALLSGMPFAPIGDDPKISAFSEMTLGVRSIDPKKFTGERSLAREIERYLELCRRFYASGGREEFIARQRMLFEDDIKAFAEFCGSVFD